MSQGRLDLILAHKRQEIADARRRLPLAEVRRAAEQAATPRDFVAALRTAQAVALAGAPVGTAVGVQAAALPGESSPAQMDALLAAPAGTPVGLLAATPASPQPGAAALAGVQAGTLPGGAAALPAERSGAGAAPGRGGPPPLALIAEIKRASPSRGPLAPGLDPAELARLYAAGGAAAISVLTDERFFQGSLDDLRRAAAAQTGLPLLRKEFVLDEYQVYEARAAGADALLLIAACLDAAQLQALHSLAQELGLTALVEVHAADELERTLACGPRLVGVNNRNLQDFSVSLETCLALRRLIPAGVPVVAESGIHTRQDVQRLAAGGLQAMLVGESLVTAWARGGGEALAGQMRELVCQPLAV